jgi:hypothetical protein
MTEQTTEAFKNLNALHRYDASSDANQPNFGLSCCRLGERAEGLRRSVSRDGRHIRLEGKSRMRSRERRALGMARQSAPRGVR